MDRIKKYISEIAKEAISLGANPDDSNDIIRTLVERDGFSFNAWFCVCCEVGKIKMDAKTLTSITSK